MRSSAVNDLTAYRLQIVGRCCITIGVMAADAFIHCRVTSDLKTLVRRLAEREGINESYILPPCPQDFVGTPLQGLPLPPDRHTAA